MWKATMHYDYAISEVTSGIISQEAKKQSSSLNNPQLRPQLNVYFTPITYFVS